jgi:hypothetical protein
MRRSLPMVRTTTSPEKSSANIPRIWQRGRRNCTARQDRWHGGDREAAGHIPTFAYTEGRGRGRAQILILASVPQDISRCRHFRRVLTIRMIAVYSVV